MSDETGSLLAELAGNLDQRPFKVVPFPGHDGHEIALWRLTLNEETQARKAAFKWVREALAFSELDLAWDEQRALYEAIAVETLAIALRSPKNPIQQFAADSDDLRDRLGSDEIAALHSLYNDFVEERAWLKTVKDPGGELDKLVDHTGKARPISMLLSRFGSPSLRKLLHIAVDRLARSTTDSCSPSTSPSG